MKMFSDVTIRSWHDRRFVWANTIGRPHKADWLVGALSAVIALGIAAFIR